MTRKRKAYIAASAAALSITLMAGCSAIQPQVRDLEGVHVEDPDKVALITNVDQYPNVVALCIHGQGFASTTRDYTSLIPIPAWGLEGGWCHE